MQWFGMKELSASPLRGGSAGGGGGGIPSRTGRLPPSVTCDCVGACHLPRKGEGTRLKAMH